MGDAGPYIELERRYYKCGRPLGVQPVADANVAQGRSDSQTRVRMYMYIMKILNITN